MRRGSRHAPRHVLLGLIATVTVALATWMIRGDLDTNDKLASIVAVFVSLAALAATVGAMLPVERQPMPAASVMADDLATTVQAQWYEEVRVRGLHDPVLLPVSWADGRTTGGVDEVARTLAARYQEVRTGRLVVLGEPGAGKSILALLLTLGLLERRETGAAVPVLVPASTWDPDRQSMDDWFIRTTASFYYNGREDIPRRLLDHGLLIPIIDGLDEVEESARRWAVQGINAAIGTNRPVVVTCRSAEYDDVIEGGAPLLRRAPVVRICPIAVNDVVAHLKAASPWPEGTSWAPVYEELTRAPNGPLATALSTPLLISLVRLVYQRCGGDPAELLDSTRFSSRHQIEDYLVDRVIDAAYSPKTPPQPTDRAWSVSNARRWLAYLARYMYQHRERDLAWWHLSNRLVSPWFAPVIGIATGVVVATAISIAAATGRGDMSAADVLGIGAVTGVLVAMVATVLWQGGSGREPARTTFAMSGSSRRLRRGFAKGAVVIVILAVPVLVAALVAVFISTEPGSGRVSALRDFLDALTLAAALGCVAGSAVAAHDWFNGPPERSAAVSPLSLLREDRSSALLGAAAAAAIAFLTFWPLVSIANVVGDILGCAVTVWLSDVDAPRPVITPSPLDGGALLGSVQASVSVFLLLLLTRAWPRFAVTRVLLAARGHLPWRLLHFLADAHRRGILRQVSGTYQFRHARLQERLVLEVKTDVGDNQGH